MLALKKGDKPLVRLIKANEEVSFLDRVGCDPFFDGVVNEFLAFPFLDAFLPKTFWIVTGMTTGRSAILWVMWWRSRKSLMTF